MKLNDKEFPYSFSQNRLYNDCPRKYKYRYVDGIKEPTNENLELGSAIHKVFELYHNVVGVEPVSKTLLEEYQNARDIIIALKGNMYFTQLVTEFDMLCEAYPMFNIGREYKIEADDFVAVIDLVNIYASASHKYSLADYKVTKKPKTDASIYDEGQLLIYKYLWCQEHPVVKPNDVAVQYINILPYLAPQIITVTKPQVPSFETCENLFNDVQKTKENILAGEFPKKKKWCKWCYYKDICDKDNT